MYRCPHCGQKGISWLRKLVIGPGAPGTCKVCGKRVGVPPWSIFLFLFLLAVLVCPSRSLSVVTLASKALAFCIGIALIVLLPLSKE
jgi:hypothetical protein